MKGTITLLNHAALKIQIAGLSMLLVFPLGCGVPTPVRFSPDEVRAEFGRIGIATTDTRPTTAFDRPMTSRWEAAGQGALAGLVIGLSVLPFFAPVTVPAFAILGASAARSPQEVEQGASALEHAVVESNIQEQLRQAVILRLTERYTSIIADKVSTVEAGAEFNTVIEVRVAEVSLKGHGFFPVDPTLRLDLHADGRVVRVGSTEGSRRIVTEGEGDSHTLLEWAGHDAKLFREQVPRELERLANTIVDEVFSRPPKGTSTGGESASKVRAE
ncbi:MAG TPA: hypothetical protein VLG10_12315 [Methylomirabilota bacterium]|nr:hypothetical protein [Methylomirabilota bacterium]